MKKMRKAVCPGSFDPMTLGHLDIFERAAAQFDEVVVLVTANPHKTVGLFSATERMALIEESISHLGNVSVANWSGLLVDYLQAHEIGTIIKGLRSSLDYEYELPMAQMNRHLAGVDTFFLLTDEKYGYLSSTLCKEVARYGGDISGLLPPHVVRAVEAKYRGREAE